MWTRLLAWPSSLSKLWANGWARWNGISTPPSLSVNETFVVGTRVLRGVERGAPIAVPVSAQTVQLHQGRATLHRNGLSICPGDHPATFMLSSVVHSDVSILMLSLVLERRVADSLVALLTGGGDTDSVDVEFVPTTLNLARLPTFQNTSPKTPSYGGSHEA